VNKGIHYVKCDQGLSGKCITHTDICFS